MSEAPELSLIKCRVYEERELFESMEDAKERMEQRCAREAAEYDEEMCDAGWEAFLIGWYAMKGGGMVIHREEIWRAWRAWENWSAQMDEDEDLYE